MSGKGNHTHSLRLNLNLKSDVNVRSSTLHVAMSSSKMGVYSEMTDPASTVSTSGSIIANFLMHDMSKPQTSSQNAIFSSLYCPSSIAPMYSVALSGNTRPSGASH